MNVIKIYIDIFHIFSCCFDPFGFLFCLDDVCMYGHSIDSSNSFLFLWIPFTLFILPFITLFLINDAHISPPKATFGL